MQKFWLYVPSMEGRRKINDNLILGGRNKLLRKKTILLVQGHKVGYKQLWNFQSIAPWANKSQCLLACLFIYLFPTLFPFSNFTIDSKFTASLLDKENMQISGGGWMINRATISSFGICATFHTHQEIQWSQVFKIFCSKPIFPRLPTSHHKRVLCAW